jgi:hypothetical protein
VLFDRVGQLDEGLELGRGGSVVADAVLREPGELTHARRVGQRVAHRPEVPQRFAVAQTRVRIRPSHDLAEQVRATSTPEAQNLALHVAGRSSPATTGPRPGVFRLSAPSRRGAALGQRVAFLAAQPQRRGPTLPVGIVVASDASGNRRGAVGSEAPFHGAIPGWPLGPGLAGRASTRPLLAGSLLAGSLLAGSLLAGSLLAGSLLAGSLLAGSLLAGSLLAASLAAGSLAPGSGAS